MNTDSIFQKKMQNGQEIDLFICIGRNKHLRSITWASSFSLHFYMGCNLGWFQWSFFSRIFEIIIFCFVVAICDLVHATKTIFHLSYVLTASGNLF